MTRIIFILVIFGFLACSKTNNEPKSTHETSASQVITKNEKPGECCFQNEEAFLDMLPDKCGPFKATGKGHAKLLCLQSIKDASLARRTYVDENGLRYKVLIKDFCRHKLDDFKHLADPKAMNLDPANDNDCKLIQSHLANGYVKYYKEDPSINNSNPTHVRVIIDSRFYLQIQSLTQTGIEQCENLFNLLPVGKLALIDK